MSKNRHSRDVFDELLVRQLSALASASIVDPKLSRVSEHVKSISSGWREVQAGLGMQMCVVAFIDPIKGWMGSSLASKPVLHYLSEQSRSNTERSLIEIPYLVPRHPDPWSDDRAATFKRRALESIRLRELEVTESYPFFVRALQQEASNTNAAEMLSDEERKHNMLFAPCGELTFVCLGWLLRRILPQRHLDQLRTLKDNDRVSSELLNMVFELVELTPEERAAEAACDGCDFKDRYPIRSTRTIAQILNWLGLMRDTCVCTRRLWLVISWLSQIGKDGSAALRNTSSHVRRYLPESSNELFSQRIRKLSTIEKRLSSSNNQASASDIITAISQVIALSISRPCSAEEWKADARFSPEAHLALRAHEEHERSWLVIPILADSAQSHGAVRFGHLHVRTIGFVLSTICVPDSCQTTAAFWLSDRLTQIHRLRAACQVVGDMAARAYYWPQVFRKLVVEQEQNSYLWSLVHEVKNHAIDAYFTMKQAESEAQCIKQKHRKLMTLLQAAATSMESLKNNMDRMLHGIFVNDSTAKEVELTKFVRRITNSFCKQRGIPKNTILVEGDRKSIRLTQGVVYSLEWPIINELLRNAQRHMPLGKDSRVLVQCKCNGASWSITITNPVSMQQSAIVPDSSTNSGLSLVASICEHRNIKFQFKKIEEGSIWECTIHGSIAHKLTTA